MIKMKSILIRYGFFFFIKKNPHTLALLMIYEQIQWFIWLGFKLENGSNLANYVWFRGRLILAQKGLPSWRPTEHDKPTSSTQIIGVIWFFIFKRKINFMSQLVRS